jgi:hypothetical protein
MTLVVAPRVGLAEDISVERRLKSRRTIGRIVGVVAQATSWKDTGDEHRPK